MEAVAVAFSWLNTEPYPVTVDTTAFPGLPDRAVALAELRSRLIAPRGTGACPSPTREAVWAELIRRAQRPHPDGATWTLACAGMALPVLTRVARRLSARFAGDPADIHAAVLTGFLHGLASVHPDQPHLLTSLRWRAFRAGMIALREALDAPTPYTLASAEPTSSAGPTGRDRSRGPSAASSSPVLTPGHQPRPGAAIIASPPAGHPELVLARAVTDGVLTPAEAALIAATRLHHVPLTDAARARAQSYHATYDSRRRAERRLLAYLTHPDDTTSTDADAGRDLRQPRHRVTRTDHSSPPPHRLTHWPAHKPGDQVGEQL